MTNLRPLIAMSAISPWILASACVAPRMPGTDPSTGDTTESITSGLTEPMPTTEPGPTTVDPTRTTEGSTNAMDTGAMPDTGGTGTSDTSTSDTGASEIDCEPEPFPPLAVEDDGYRRFELCGWSVYMSIALFDGTALRRARPLTRAPSVRGPR